MVMEGQWLNEVPVGTHTGLCSSNNPCRTVWENGEIIETYDLLNAQAEVQNKRAH